jgi:hypothetical protein
MYGYEFYIFLFILIYYVIYLNAYDIVPASNKKTLYYNDKHSVIPILI